MKVAFYTAQSRAAVKIIFDGIYNQIHCDAKTPPK